MFLVRRDFPVVRFDGLRNDLGRFFKDFRSDFGDLLPFEEHVFPALNVRDDGEHLIAEVEVPGFKMDDLEVSVMGDQLTIKGRRELLNEEGTTYHRREWSSGEFARTLTLPIDVDAEKVEATLSDGVLTITLPKAQTAMVRKIAVKGA